LPVVKTDKKPQEGISPDPNEMPTREQEIKNEIE